MSLSRGSSLVRREVGTAGARRRRPRRYKAAIVYLSPHVYQAAPGLDIATPVTNRDIRYYLFHPSENILSTDTAWHGGMDNTVDPGDPAYSLLESLGLHSVPIHADDVSHVSAPGLHIVEQETNNTEQIIHDEDLEHMLDLDLENAREEPDDIDHDGTPRDSVSAAITNQPPDLRQSLNDRSISVQHLVDPAAFESPKCQKPEAGFTKRPQFERHIRGCLLGKLNSCWVCAEERKVAFARTDALQRHFEAKHLWAPAPSRKG
ncbi:predicted protein [Postia placenta Mad-698-R]|nr:predicted protein [Postia placenta Mad-698-R]